MLRALTLLAVALTATACASVVTDADPAPTYDAAPTVLALDVRDASLLPAVDAALARLRAATGIDVAIGAVPGAVPVSLTDVREPCSPEAAAAGDCSDQWFGRYDFDQVERTARVRVWTGTPADLTEAVVLHEIVHALGVAHVEQETGLMSPGMGQSTCMLTAVDLTELCAVQVCTAFAPER
jgi:hypothetical protein